MLHIIRMFSACTLAIRAHIHVQSCTCPTDGFCIAPDPVRTVFHDGHNCIWHRFLLDESFGCMHKRGNKDPISYNGDRAHKCDNDVSWVRVCASLWPLPVVVGPSRPVVCDVWAQWSRVARLACPLRVYLVPVLLARLGRRCRWLVSRSRWFAGWRSPLRPPCFSGCAASERDLRCCASPSLRLSVAPSTAAPHLARLFKRAA